MFNHYQSSSFLDKIFVAHLHRHSRDFGSKRIGPLIAVICFALIAFFVFAVNSTPSQHLTKSERYIGANYNYPPMLLPNFW